MKSVIHKADRGSGHLTEKDPNFAAAHAALAKAYGALGEHIGNAYAREGRRGQALALIPKLKEQVNRTGVGRCEIAPVWAGLQEPDQAFEWLEKSYQVRDKGLSYLKVDPCVDSLRSDPRFSSTLQRVGFPPN